MGLTLRTGDFDYNNETIELSLKTIFKKKIFFLHKDLICVQTSKVYFIKQQYKKKAILYLNLLHEIYIIPSRKEKLYKYIGLQRRGLALKGGNYSH